MDLQVVPDFEVLSNFTNLPRFLVSYFLSSHVERGHYSSEFMLPTLLLNIIPFWAKIKPQNQQPIIGIIHTITNLMINFEEDKILIFRQDASE